MLMKENKYEIYVDDIEPFVNDQYIGFRILWSGNIGFGEYTVYKYANGDTWYADDECMENPKEDKKFLKELLNNFIMQVKVE